MKISDFLEDELEDNSVYNAEYYDEIKLKIGGKEENNKTHAEGILREVKDDINDKLKDENLKKDILIVFGEEFEFADDAYFLKLDTNSNIEEKFKRLIINTGNIVGTVNKSYSNTSGNMFNSTINIHSRFGNHFFHYLLAYTEGFLELEDLGAYSQEDDLYWALIYLWKTKLKQAYRSGLPKLYETKREELSKLRGSLDLKKQFKTPYDNARYPCQYREHTYDNQITRLIAYTFEVLMRKFQPQNASQNPLTDVLRLKNVFTQACRKPQINLRELEQLEITNPYYQKYNQVVELSKKIIRNEAVSIRNNERNFSGFLFDISLLFEHHIRKLFREFKGDFRLWGKEAGELEINAGETTRGLIPDIIIEKGNQLFVYDVKYKRFDKSDNGNNRVNRNDMFQIVTYASKLASKHDYQLTGCGFIYPHSYNPEDSEKKGKRNMISTSLALFKDLKFNILFYEIPQIEENDEELELEEFKELMKDNNRRLKEDLLKALNLKE